MKEIGSEMSISPKLLLGKKINELSEDSIFLSTGRDCLEFIIQHLRLTSDDVVMLPAYLCPEMLDPFIKHMVRIRFYKIRKDLTISPQDFLGEISKGDVKMVLIINYFGWPDPGRTDVRLLCDQYKAVLVEDCAQSLLSTFPKIGDLEFYTYRKSIAIPDGASIKGINNEWSKVLATITSTGPTRFARTRLKAGLLKNIKFLKPVWRKLFLKAEKELVNNYERPAKMLPSSKRILLRTDYESIGIKRRNNYEFLAIGVNNRIYPAKLQDDVVPFGMPIICEERDAVKDKLIKEKIYPPIHWHLPEMINKELYPESHWLSEHILTIPVDQRYDENDMERIIEVLR